MGTEIFKIEEEMTEKLKPKLGNPSLTAHSKYSLIIFTILWCIWVSGYKFNFFMSSNFRLNFLSPFFFKFKNISGHLTANILNFPKHPQFFHFG